MKFYLAMGFPGGSDGKESSCNAGDASSIPGLVRFPWRREWLLTPVFLYGEFHGQRSLVATVHWVTKSQTGLNTQHSTSPPQTKHFLSSCPSISRTSSPDYPRYTLCCAPRRTVLRRQLNRGEPIHSIISHVPAGMTILAA